MFATQNLQLANNDYVVYKFQNMFSFKTLQYNIAMNITPARRKS